MVRSRSSGWRLWLTLVLFVLLVVVWQPVPIRSQNTDDNNDDDKNNADDDANNDTNGDDKADDSKNVDDNGQSSRNLDQFSYRTTVTIEDDGSINNVYGPEDWDRIECPDADLCIGWPEKYPNPVAWEIGTTNHCISCPDTGNNCGVHHNSPINLERRYALPDDRDYNMCMDDHWMQYFDSSCSFDELREQNAFIINRHGLKIAQPMNVAGGREAEKNYYKINCREQPGVGTQWGRIDFSDNFPEWWFLSHIDFKVPSEHYQDGKRYDGEIQLHHIYSVFSESDHYDNQLATVGMFLQVLETAQDWDVLNRIICAWRETEDKTREECGLPSVRTSYPGCFYYTRGHAGTTDDVSSTQGTRKTRKLRTDESASSISKAKSSVNKAVSAHDILMENYINMALYKNSSYEPKKIIIDEHNYDPKDDFDWDSFIADQYKQDEVRQNTRHLMDYAHVPWFNYFPMLKVRTEYYFRYAGSQTIPPCYGKYEQSMGKAQTNQWRLMKDPIQITQRQLDELHRLIKERIAPKDDPVRACKPDTAAAEDPNDATKISVARPLQNTEDVHSPAFCECINWGSKWIEDQNWCHRYKDQLEERLVNHPFNWDLGEV